MTERLHIFEDVADRFPHPFALVNIEREDQPLVHVNDAFCRLTGYPRGEIIGRNCRFLQGDETSKADIAYIAKGIANQQAVYCDLLNYKKDGTKFYNRLVLVPVHLLGQQHYAGIQIDATAEVAAMRTKTHLEFDQFKTSERIKDRIGNSLMKIQLVVDSQLLGEDGQIIVRTAVNDIYTCVKEIPMQV